MYDFHRRTGRLFKHPQSVNRPAMEQSTISNFAKVFCFLRSIWPIRNRTADTDILPIPSSRAARRAHQRYPSIPFLLFYILITVHSVFGEWKFRHCFSLFWLPPAFHDVHCASNANVQILIPPKEVIRIHRLGATTLSLSPHPKWRSLNWVVYDVYKNSNAMF